MDKKTHNARKMKKEQDKDLNDIMEAMKVVDERKKQIVEKYGEPNTFTKAKLCQLLYKLNKDTEFASYQFFHKPIIESFIASNGKEYNGLFSVSGFHLRDEIFYDFNKLENSEYIPLNIMIEKINEETKTAEPLTEMDGTKEKLVEVITHVRFDRILAMDRYETIDKPSFIEWQFLKEMISMFCLGRQNSVDLTFKEEVEKNGVLFTLEKKDD